MIAAPQLLSADIEVPGSLMANESTDIHPEVSGRMVELHINAVLSGLDKYMLR